MTYLQGIDKLTGKTMALQEPFAQVNVLRLDLHTGKINCNVINIMRQKKNSRKYREWHPMIRMHYIHKIRIKREHITTMRVARNEKILYT